MSLALFFSFHEESRHMNPLNSLASSYEDFHKKKKKLTASINLSVLCVFESFSVAISCRAFYGSGHENQAVLSSPVSRAVLTGDSSQEGNTSSRN